MTGRMCEVAISVETAVGTPGANAGASFSGETVRTKLVVPVSVPSLAARVIVADPLALAAGVMVKVREAPLPLITSPDPGTTASLDDDATTPTPASGVSPSLTVKPTAIGVSSGVDFAPTGATTGGARAATVSVNVVTAGVPPSRAAQRHDRRPGQSGHRRHRHLERAAVGRGGGDGDRDAGVGQERGVRGAGGERQGAPGAVDVGDGDRRLRRPRQERRWPRPVFASRPAGRSPASRSG